MGTCKRRSAASYSERRRTPCYQRNERTTMPWDCRECGLVNTDESQVCDCGYNRVAGMVGPRPDGLVAEEMSWGHQYHLLKLTVAGAGVSLAGLGLLCWELADDMPTTMGIVRAIVMIVLGAVLAFIILRQFG